MSLSVDPTDKIDKIGPGVFQLLDIAGSVERFAAAAEYRSKDHQGVSLVWIHCLGGSVFEGFALYQAVAKHRHLSAYDYGTLGSGWHDPENPCVHIGGLCCGCATLLLATGGHRSIDERGFISLGETTMATTGSAEANEHAAKLAEEIDGKIAKALAKASGQDPADVRRWMKERRWFNAHQALAAGLVDEIGPILNQYGELSPGLNLDTTTIENARASEVRMVGGAR